jgi:hypothetical protein
VGRPGAPRWWLGVLRELLNLIVAAEKQISVFSAATGAF